jgi:2,4-diketo-3-deoxy-L-fuconate hydrolase
MRICRFNDDRIGIARPDGIHDVTAIVEELPAAKYPFPIGDLLITHLERLRGKLEDLADRSPPVAPESVSFLSPVANPTKIVGVPTNYRAHVEEMEVARAQRAGAAAPAGGNRAASGVQAIRDQGFFLKANSSLVGPSEGVTIRFPNRRNDHEAELGIVIGRPCSNVSEEKAYDYVAGYALALDMVVRGPEDRSFRKSIDSYSVLGPWLVSADEIPDPQNLDLELRVNGQVRQKSNTREMIMNIREQIAFASTFYTLLPGDIIMTGTCEGVGPVKDGDVMDVEIERIGRMRVPVYGPT